METRVMELLTEAGYGVKAIESVKGGVKVKGIAVDQGTNAMPTFYPALMDGSADDIATAIIGTLKSIEPKTFELDILADYEAVKGRLIVALRPVVAGDPDMITRPFLDLEMVAKVVIGTDEGGQSAARVSRGLVKTWGVTEDEVFAKAIANGHEFKSFEFFGMDILSNEAKVDGAAVMLYPDEFKPLAEKFDDDVVIIPSSRHEVIAMPAGNISSEEAAEMIQNVNSTEVEPQDVLSDHAYIYRRGSNTVEVY